MTFSLARKLTLPIELKQLDPFEPSFYALSFINGDLQKDRLLVKHNAIMDKLIILLLDVLPLDPSWPIGCNCFLIKLSEFCPHQSKHICSS